MKFEINDTLLKAIEDGAEAIRSNMMHIRRELKEKNNLESALFPVIEAKEQQADILEGFVKRVRWMEENHDRF